MRYRRMLVKGGCYFITINLAERKRTLLIDNINQLKFSIFQVKRRHPFNIEAIVVLPDHLHLMMFLPSDDSDYSKRLSLIKSNFSRQIIKDESITDSRKLKRERGIWQRRFWEHCIRDEKDYELHVDYIHYNPVKHGYVAKPIDWKYSSIHLFVKSGLISSDWSGGLNL